MWCRSFFFSAGSSECCQYRARCWLYVQLCSRYVAAVRPCEKTKKTFNVRGEEQLSQERMIASDDPQVAIKQNRPRIFHSQIWTIFFPHLQFPPPARHQHPRGRQSHHDAKEERTVDKILFSIQRNKERFQTNIVVCMTTTDDNDHYTYEKPLQQT